VRLAEAFAWLGQDTDFEREWQAALAQLPEERQSAAWNWRGQTLRTAVCNPRASLAAYRRAAELLPADAPLSLRVDILLGAAWCESAADDPARATALLAEVTSLVTEPTDTIVAQMAAAEVGSLIRQAARARGAPDTERYWSHAPKKRDIMPGQRSGG
jgi:hypothetical protein